MWFRFRNHMMWFIESSYHGDRIANKEAAWICYFSYEWMCYGMCVFNYAIMSSICSKVCFQANLFVNITSTWLYKSSIGMVNRLPQARNLEIWLIMQPFCFFMTYLLQEVVQMDVISWSIFCMHGYFNLCWSSHKELNWIVVAYYLWFNINT